MPTIKIQILHAKILGIKIGYWLQFVSKERYKLLKNQLRKKITLEKFYQNNFYEEYAEDLLTKNLSDKDKFVPISEDKYNFSEFSPKLIAFYLPQFHTFEENDEWHGRGFTEWTNVTRAVPHFVGHNQPKLPIDVGFYDLNNIDVMRRQVELAKMYGVSGFCFHYYWFSGKRLMEKPIFNWLENKDIDFPFCLCWANENWSKLWDGGNREVLMEQRLDDGDDEHFFEDILPFFKDNRYIKINGKPLLIIYRPWLFEKERFLRFVEIMRSKAKKDGFVDLFLVMAMTSDIKDKPDAWGMDAGVEFPPHGFSSLVAKKDLKQINPNYVGTVYDMTDFVERGCGLKNVEYKLFKTIFPNWDNTARKAYSEASVFQLEPVEYKKWLKNVIDWTKERYEPAEQFVFINAWNEWAEGACLEPDFRYGYAYLQATKDALEGK